MLELKKLQIQYLKTTSGETTAVVIPIRQWNQLEEDYQKILKHTKTKNRLKPASQEIKRVRALESIKGIVTKNKIYTVLLIKDKFFPEGEECILGNNKEYVTLDCFKREIVS